MRFIGDIHGKFGLLKGILDSQPSELFLQVGDLGHGFKGRMYHDKHDPPTDCPVYPRDRFRFIRGNHDNPGECRKHPNYLGEWGLYEDVFFIGGANSVDRAYRVQDVDWWANEEIDSDVFVKEIAPVYTDLKPRIVMTHDCPSQIAVMMLNILDIRKEARFESSKTQRCLQMLFNRHQPEHWFFGHYHTNWDTAVNGTQFHCLGEASVSAPLKP